ncbi:hypothetical protein QKU48_gp0150 [Fadolivirus algeromassiliense]|jgi:hypothetical protein|uniref:Uncharacterized protein n=1 Tax=Fadolivirus FV1/VV64 TaxID=3070911 RepID=A0A7D3UNV3_9VIRU|nr:hypothetical protein QKU48_gp0150 [Fadolivirus algeromassiliense]QKF93608.1 hypothetical protein Fadolivirus_1_150 [Fadolivirus FV1/VV64]
MNQTQTIFGWAGSNDIFEVVKMEFPEEECKKIYSNLFFKVETQNKNSKKIDKTIRPFKGINNLMPDKFLEEKNQKDKSITSYLYSIKYSAYDKIFRMKKYIDLINCKYCTGLKFNFCYTNKGYTFLMYFDEPSKNNLDMQKLNGYLSQWNRMKDIFKLDPKIYSIDHSFFVKSTKPNVPWPVNDKFKKDNQNDVKLSYDISKNKFEFIDDEIEEEVELPQLKEQPVKKPVQIKIGSKPMPKKIFNDDAALQADIEKAIALSLQDIDKKKESDDNAEPIEIPKKLGEELFNKVSDEWFVVKSNEQNENENKELPDGWFAVKAGKKEEDVVNKTGWIEVTDIEINDTVDNMDCEDECEKECDYDPMEDFPEEYMSSLQEDMVENIDE